MVLSKVIIPKKKIPPTHALNTAQCYPHGLLNSKYITTISLLNVLHKSETFLSIPFSFDSKKLKIHTRIQYQKYMKMVEEFNTRTDEGVYDIGLYDYGGPCRYLQQAFRSFLKCLGLEKEEGGGGGGGGGDGGGTVVDDPPATSPSDDPTIMDPADGSATGRARRRPPPRGPISTGGPGQTN